MRLVIAEKGSVAKAIRAALPNDVRVTHCVGHLLAMAEPAAYDPRWKRWDSRTLPISVTNWKLVPVERTKQQLAVIGGLLKQATEVVNAGDPGREGQLLVDEVLDYFGWHGRTLRMLVTDTRPEAIRRAWSQLKDNANYQLLRRSAECRQRADWLIGVNLTRASTRLLSHGALISIGRVQTPTLALVVKRQDAIGGFTEEKFYTLRATITLSGDRWFELRYEPNPRITAEREAAALARAVEGQDAPLRVVSQDKRRQSPLPYKLGDFQGAAERHYGWSIAGALAALQKAYEAGWVTYPRSDCRYLPDEHQTTVVALGQKMATALGIDPKLAAAFRPSPRVFDSKKIEEHYGIVPTGDVPSPNGDPDAIKAWRLVTLHFLETLLPDVRYAETRVTATFTPKGDGMPDELAFSAASRMFDDAINWTSLALDKLLPPVRLGSGKKQSSAPDSFPPIKDGQIGHCEACKRHRGKTTPPKPYTEASLRLDMEQVAKYTTDPKVSAILKESLGLGTAATQASIIETLLRRGYINHTPSKTLRATPFGVAVIRATPTQLADPVLTATWEEALRRMAGGSYDPGQFMVRVEKFVQRNLGAIRNRGARGVRVAGSEDRRPNTPRTTTRAKKPASSGTKRHKSEWGSAFI